MPSVVLGDGGDRDESGLGPALKKSNEQTDPHIDGQRCAEAGESRRVLFGVWWLRKEFPEEGLLELNLRAAGRRCQARVEESMLGGRFGMSKDGRCAGVLLVVGAQGGS